MYPEIAAARGVAGVYMSSGYTSRVKPSEIAIASSPSWDSHAGSQEQNMAGGWSRPFCTTLILLVDSYTFRIFHQAPGFPFSLNLL